MHLLRAVVVVVGTALLLTPATAQAAAAPVPGVTEPQGRAAPVEDPADGVIVVWAEDADEPARVRARLDLGLLREGRLPGVNGEVVDLRPGQSAGAVAARVSADPRVDYAEPDVRMRPSVLPSDEFFDLQWGLHNTGQEVRGSTGVTGVDVGISGAYDNWLAAGLPGPVVVAVIDSGIDLTHPDLVESAWTNQAEVRGNGVDDDGNGYVDDVHGWDFTGGASGEGDASTYEDPLLDEHGTHVAGVIGATVDNGRGTAGVAPSVQLMVLKALGSNGGSASDVIEAIGYAEAQGARIVNASFGSSNRSQAVADAISGSQMLFVVAAGNGGDDGIGDDTAVSPEWPAAERLPNLLSVAAVDSAGRLAEFSNYGAAVDLGAPGVDIASTIPANDYTYLDGTSMAAPHVAGAAALAATMAPGLTAPQLRSLLLETVRPLDGLTGRTASGGMVDAGAATARLVPEASPSQPPPAEPSPSPSEPPPAEPSPSPSEPPPAEPEPSPSETPPAGTPACPDDDVPPADFPDVDPASVHAPRIDCVAWWQVALGNGGQYAPSEQVTRGQMASFLYRVVREERGEVVPVRDYFSDDNGSTHEAASNALAELGIVRGRTADEYAPRDVVTRAEMATFVVRTQELLSGALLAGGGTPFSDVPASVHSASIDKAWTAGLVRGTSITTYSPGRAVQRDAMASFLANLLDLLVRTDVLAPRAG